MKNETILVVEDEPAIREMIVTTLERWQDLIVCKPQKSLKPIIWWSIIAPTSSY